MNKDIFKTTMTAIEVVEGIVKENPVIKGLAFYVYAPQPNVFESAGESLLSRLLFHDSTAGKEKWLNREEITVDKLYKTVGGLEKEYVLSVLSKVVLKRNELFHVPLMDFAGGSSMLPAHDLARIVYFLEKANYGNGVILYSGRSFHYYGNYLMNDKEWRVFLGDCLLSGLADSRYVGHCLKDGCAVLRLSACSLRHHVPKVVSILE